MLAPGALSPTDYATLIADNGPAGLLILVVFVLLGVAIKQRATSPSNAVNQGVYISTWIMIAVLIVVSAIAWWIPHLARPTVLKGTINDLPLNYLVRGGNNSEDLSFYTRPESDGQGGAKLRFHWLAMEQHPLSGKLSIVVYAPSNALLTDSASYGRELLVPIDDPKDTTPLTIVFRDNEHYMLRLPNGQETALEVQTASLGWGPFAPRSDAIVYAATTLDESAMKARLEAPDPITRRQARTDLAGLGMDAMPFIDKVLADRNSSPALHFGVLLALATMQSSVPSETKLSGLSLVYVMGAVSDKNPDIANGAQAYVNKRGAFQVHQALVNWMQETHNAQPEKRLNDDALAGMDFMYLYGINEKDAYGGRRDSSLFHGSEQAFQMGWDDRSFAEPDQQVYFAEALYGWGLLLADRAVLERRPDGTKDPQRVTAAQAKFVDFLKAVGNGRYPFKNQIATAKAYLVTPTLNLNAK